MMGLDGYLGPLKLSPTVCAMQEIYTGAPAQKLQNVGPAGAQVQKIPIPFFVLMWATQVSTNPICTVKFISASLSCIDFLALSLVMFQVQHQHGNPKPWLLSSLFYLKFFPPATFRKLASHVQSMGIPCLPKSQALLFWYITRMPDTSFTAIIIIQ